MPRPRSLTRTAIAAAAVAVLDRGGLASFSMRAVAAELGTSAMALYRYVDDRAELELLVVEQVLSGVDLVLPTHGAWSRQIELLMQRLRDGVAAHPAAIPLLVLHRHSSPASLNWIEAMLGVLSRAGFSGTRRVIAQRTLVHYLIGALQTEHLGPLSGPGTVAMADLPGSEFPHIAEAARQARRIPADEEFRRGLACILSGLASG